MVIETLRPNAPGDVTNLQIQAPAAGEANWEDVDEAVADGNTSYLGIDNTTPTQDLYNLPASTGVGVINSVKVYVVLRSDAAHVMGMAYINVKTGGVSYDSALVGPNIPAAWTNYDNTWANNPGGGAWTWAQIDALQIGITLWSAPHVDAWGFITQIYVEVDYTIPPGWTGEISGVTDPAKIQGVAKADIAAVKGVA